MPCTGFHCCLIVNNEKIAVSEKRSSFTLLNSNELDVAKVSFDGCHEYNYAGKRCDYIFILKKNNEKIIILVELKGKNIEHAIKQLEESVSYLKLLGKKPIYFCIVSSRSPIASADIQNYAKRLRSKNIILESKNMQMIKKYDDF